MHTFTGLFLWILPRWHSIKYTKIFIKKLFYIMHYYLELLYLDASSCDHCPKSFDSPSFHQSLRFFFHLIAIHWHVRLDKVGPLIEKPGGFVPFFVPLIVEYFAKPSSSGFFSSKCLMDRSNFFNTTLTYLN